MFSRFRKPETTEEPIDEDKHGVEIISDDPQGATEHAPAAPSVTPEELARLQNLGVLLVNMGAADEVSVFGSKNSTTMQAYRQRKAPDLLIIHRPEDDLPRQQVRWYKPWTWFSGGPQISPPRWGDLPRAMEPPSSAAGLEGGDALENANATSTVDAERKAAIEAAVADRMREQKEDTDSQKSKRRRRKRAGLPPVPLESLTDKQVRDELTDTVREDRDKLLESERTVHELLQGIEDTRFRYLVPAMEISCEPQVIHVIQCYDKQNKIADQRLRDEAKTRKTNNERLPVGLRASMEDEEMIAKRAVNYEVLACGDLVSELRRCADDMALNYSKGEGMNP